jgi:hypothetical protein
MMNDEHWITAAEARRLTGTTPDPCASCAFRAPAPVAIEPTRREAVKVVAKVVAKDVRHVADATRDGLLFEAVTHGCAALVGVGLWPLVETAAHALLKVVVG